MAGAALLGPGLLRRWQSGALVLSASVVQAVLLALTPLVGHLVIAVGLQVGVGFLTSVAGGSFLSLIQAATCQDMLGRVMSVASLAMVGLAPLAYTLSGFVVGTAGPAAVFLGGAAAQALAAGSGLAFATVRRATPQTLRVRAGTSPDTVDRPKA